MPEIKEELLLLAFILWFMASVHPDDLIVTNFWTDARNRELDPREERLLKYAATFTHRLLELGLHPLWAVCLSRLADSIPDTHGSMIRPVCSYSF
jgi:hypothetical protein